MAKTLADIAAEISALPKYTEDTQASPVNRLWNDMQDRIMGVVQDLVDHINAGEGAEMDFEPGMVLSSVDPDFNPNTSRNGNGLRRYAGTWQRVQEGLVQYTATSGDGDYQLTSRQIKQMLSSYRNISGANLPSDKFKLGGVTGNPSEADGSSANLNLNLDFWIGTSGMSWDTPVIGSGRNLAFRRTPGPRIRYNGDNWNGTYVSQDAFNWDANHHHTLDGGYVQFNQGQSQFDVRQAGFLAFSWVRTV